MANFNVAQNVFCFNDSGVETEAVQLEAEVRAFATTTGSRNSGKGRVAGRLERAIMLTR